MKVLFLIQGFTVAASRYRVLQYIPYLESHGVEVTVSPYPRTLRENFQLFRTLPDYSAVFLQRKRFTGPRLILLRKRAKRIIYDFDDSVMFRNSMAGRPESRTRRKRFARMVRASDFVVAGNQFLKENVLPLNPNVEVIPTPIDLNRYPQKDWPVTEGKVTLGWIGDHGSIYYLKQMKPIFEEIGKRHPHAELKIVCDNFFDCENLHVEKSPWSSETEIRDLQSFDVGVMPLEEDPWSWGKCGLKIIQYQGVGVPVVCTPVGINRDLVEDGVNGFWARTPEEWTEKLSALIKDPLLREKMGTEGRKRVQEGYVLQVCAPRLLSVLKRTVEQDARK